MTLTPEDMLKAKQKLQWSEDNIEIVADIYDNHYILHCMICWRVIGHTTGPVDDSRMPRNICGHCLNEFSIAVRGVKAQWGKDE